MCGRFTLRTPAHVLISQFQLTALPALSPRYNIAPTQQVLVVRQPAPDAPRNCQMMHWGLVPSWAKDPAIGNKMINARRETLATKPSYRNAFRRRRCLVVADGYYEWQKVGSRKQPYHVHLPGHRPFAFAGLWEAWSGVGSQSGESPWLSCTIVTTDASPLLRTIHDRMPVVVPEEAYAAWLDPEQQESAAIEALMGPWDDLAWCCDPVDTYVNRPQHDDPRCLQPAE